MSTAVMAISPTPPITRRVRAYFAPVNRAAGAADNFRPCRWREFHARFAACSVAGSGMDRQFRQKVHQLQWAAESGQPGGPADAGARAGGRVGFISLSDVDKAFHGSSGGLGTHEPTRDCAGCKREWFRRDTDCRGESDARFHVHSIGYGRFRSCHFRRRADGGGGCGLQRTDWIRRQRSERSLCKERDEHK